MNEIELAYLSDALKGGDFWIKEAESMIREQLNVSSALLTNSCTSALEMCALLLDIGPGDEVIMPSFTFTSTANAVALRGGIPVFVDVDPRTLNMDVNEALTALTPNTRAICVVHYAGVCCDFPVFDSPVPFIEDAAQAYLSTYKGIAAGNIGMLAAISFHHTKNIECGEGGVLCVTGEYFKERAEIIREKGTNRSAFLRGEVDKYTWRELGSSYIPSNLQAAVLCARLHKAKEITAKRMAMWNLYHGMLGDLEQEGYIERPYIPPECVHNAHIYRVMLPTPELRDRALKAVTGSSSHYQPLHNSPAGQKYGRVSGSMKVTEKAVATLLRLPLGPQTTSEKVEHAVEQLASCLRK